MNGGQSLCRGCSMMYRPKMQIINAMRAEHRTAREVTLSTHLSIALPLSCELSNAVLNLERYELSVTRYSDQGRRDGVLVIRPEFYAEALWDPDALIRARYPPQ